VETSLSNSKADTLKAHLALRLRDEGLQISKFFAEVNPESWDAIVYTEGARWTVRQVLAHFIATERALRMLVEGIRAGGSGAPDGFDIDAFNEAQVRSLDSETPSNLQEMCRLERERTLQMLNELRASDLLLQGRHPYFGTMAIHQLLKWIYQHAQVHLRDLRRITPQ
jgi:hypothetical protein